MSKEVILVTGAVGFIGGHLSEALLDAGHQIIGIDSLDPYYNPELKRMTLQLLRQHSNFQFEKVDFLQMNDLYDIINVCQALLKNKIKVKEPQQNNNTIEKAKEIFQDDFTPY